MHPIKKDFWGSGPGTELNEKIKFTFKSFDLHLIRYAGNSFVRIDLVKISFPGSGPGADSMCGNYISEIIYVVFYQSQYS